MPSSLDTDMMARALQLAKRGLYSTDPNPRVGCVIVRDEEIVGEGFTNPVGGPHAEVNALEMAGEAARGSTAYVTLEPCSHFGKTPPCTTGLINAGVKRVVYAIEDPNPRVNGGGAQALQAAGIKVNGGILAAQAQEMNIGFFRRMQTGMPWVTVKMGASIDGKVALANGVSQWITSDAARLDVQRQRARSSAVLTGSGTVMADDPRLTVRADDIDMQGRRVLRVVCDSKLQTSPSAKLFTESGPILFFAVEDLNDRRHALEAAGAQISRVAADGVGRVELQSALRNLAERECNEVLVEAGPTLSGRFIELGLADEVLIYFAPVVLGSDGRSMFATPRVEAMAERWNFRVHEMTRVGPDIRVRLRRPDRGD
jgi:diaminohydroxyphosphoribosylaminopyrimidine deaminase/5-amino-6-(5-phosphoribosylamino)uracil reductase